MVKVVLPSKAGCRDRMGGTDIDVLPVIAYP